MPDSNDANNAFFATSAGVPSLFFGDLRAFDDDAIAHEYGHGNFVGHVPNQPSIYRFWDDWFSANEFYADFSTVLTDVYRQAGVMSESTWAISDFRNWRDPQSKSVSYNDWYPHRFFHDPVNIGSSYSNSTIYGYAVYLMLNGGPHRRAGQAALNGPIPNIYVPTATLSQVKEVLSTGLWFIYIYNDQFTALKFKQRTMEAASAIYGPVSGVMNTVESAWTSVGIGRGCIAPRPRLSSLFSRGTARGGTPSLGIQSRTLSTTEWPFQTLGRGNPPGQLRWWTVETRPVPRTFPGSPVTV